MEFQTIILKKEDRIATIALNRPRVLNAMNQQMIHELTQALEEVSKDDTRVLVIKGMGRAFCAGADVRFAKLRSGEVATEEAEDMPSTRQDVRRGKLLPQPTQLKLTLQRLDKPTIAMVNGAAVGSGFDLALACDMRIGSPEAKFMVAHTRVGFPPDSGGTWFMPRIMGLGRALEYIFTGDFCSAEEAYRIGLLNRLVPTEQLEEETRKLAQKLAMGPPIAYRLSKLQVYKGLDMDLETALAFAIACVSIAASSDDHKEAVRAIAEKRTPNFRDR
jgi:2-(1,2-epoxy-1,2-dihydrophenyl)acetyl-CoA isomerase